MEEKLAEFRARRQAQNATKRTKCLEVPTELAKVRSTTCEREGTAESADSSTVPESARRQVRLNEKMKV